MGGCVLALLLGFAVSTHGWSAPGVNGSKVDQLHPIVGGKRVQIEDFPHQLYMEVDLSETQVAGCGAAIISSTWALTAAHCCVEKTLRGLRTFQPRQVSLRTGSSRRHRGGSVHSVVQVRPHEDYAISKAKNPANDICLLKVGTPFAFDSKTWIVGLPRSPLEYRPDRETYISGWGHEMFQGVSSDYLMATMIPLITNEECQEDYRHLSLRLADDITESVFCAYREGKDTCQGDSGGALVAGGKLLGVVSWGAGCGVYPGVYTRVTSYRSWIKSIAGI